MNQRDRRRYYDGLQTGLYCYDVRPIGPATRCYGDKWWRFHALIEGEVKPVSIRFPVRDRRVARRIARDTGERFRMVNGYAAISDPTVLAQQALEIASAMIVEREKFLNPTEPVNVPA